MTEDLGRESTTNHLQNKKNGTHPLLQNYLGQARALYSERLRRGHNVNEDDLWDIVHQALPRDEPGLLLDLAMQDKGLFIQGVLHHGCFHVLDQDENSEITAADLVWLSATTMLYHRLRAIHEQCEIALKQARENAALRTSGDPIDRKQADINDLCQAYRVLYRQAQGQQCPLWMDALHSVIEIIADLCELEESDVRELEQSLRQAAGEPVIDSPVIGSATT